MKLAIMQPYCFPYIGYFQLINAVDKFVFYDDVNFIKKGYINRNNILIQGKRNLFTIPCKEISQNKLINQVYLDFDIKDQEKFLKKLKHAYSKAPYFKVLYPLLESFIKNDRSVFISEYAIATIKFVTDFLGLNTKFEISSQKYADTIELRKENRLKEICNSENASDYINAIGGKSLYRKEDFLEKNINLKFLSSSSIDYQQFDNNFVPNLSIIDVLMFNSKGEVMSFLNNYQLVD